jgi:asparagine synthase (glutamine-hydrolysing)
MCGICGLVGFDNLDAITAMTGRVAHRGPDDGGEMRDEGGRVALGHRRLSILDRSARGRQPMSSGDGRIHLTFNGEIYNYRALQETLDPTRHQFRSGTDTEVILHLYEARGRAAFAALDGMFAFALYDMREGRLYLVRDPLGIKPLYYGVMSGKLLFGSEIKCLLASGAYRPEIDWQSVHDFFSFLYVPSPRTMFAGIEQLLPGHYLEYDLRRREVAGIHRYWDPWSGRQNVTDKGRTQTEWKQEIRQTLGAAVERQRMGDVPVGAFLSGGVDSNILVGLMAEQSAIPVQTFTMRFDEAGMDYYDERHEARRIATRFGTHHQEIPVDLAHPEEMLDLVEYFDQPFGNTTFYLTWLLSRQTRQQVTVALSGAGGDELFGGYPRYRAVQAMRWLRWIPPAIGKAGVGLLRPFRDQFGDRRLHRMRALLGGLDPDPAEQYLRWVYYLDEERKAGLLSPRGQEGSRLPSSRILAERLSRVANCWPAGPEDGNRFSWLDIETFLPDNILTYTDRMSMAWGLEVRVPFLDPALVELALTIPFSLKQNRQGSKWILRETFADLIPEANRHVPKKGFNLPLGVWMRTRFDRFFDKLLPRDYVEREGIFRFDAIQQMREEHRRGLRDNGYELFALLLFDTWYRKYITGRAQRGEGGERR